jgi:hypothetical protein
MSTLRCMDPTNEDTKPAGRDRRRGVVVGAVAGAVVLAIVAALVVANIGDDDGGTRTAAPPDRTTETTGAATTTTPTTEAETTTTVGPSAADGLEPFFSAATSLDAQLHDAAEAINGAGPPWPEVPDSVVDAVTTADIVPVGRSIPAGLPPDLLRASVLVYSDLVSRRAAMQGFAYAGPVDYEPAELLLGLANGHAAAERFDGDLAAARSLAAATPPFEPAPLDARETAEVLLLVYYVDGANLGCGSRGGIVLTELPPIVWATEVVPDGTPTGSVRDGSIGAVDFSADLQPDGTWKVQLWAC